jgi:signal transduction histidine kinase
MSDLPDSAPVVSDWSRSGLGRRLALPRWGFQPPRWAAMGTQLWMLSVALVALICTLVLQAIGVRVHSASAVTMMDTASGLIGLLASFVFLERLRVSGQRRDLVIAVALAVLGLTNLLAAAGPTTLSASPAGAWEWLLLLATLGGGAMLLGAVCWRLDAERSRLPRAILAGVVVVAVASFDYLLVSAAGGERLYAADILKLIGYLLILYGCLLELGVHRRGLVQRVAVNERRRMARDMHDGLAQELAFIATHSQRLGNAGDDATTVAHLRAAAERALHDSRTTIAVLTSAEDVPLDLLVVRTVDSFRSRFGVEVDLDLAGGVAVDAEQRNALLRILHEALTNAVRHGGAEQVFVRLSTGPSGLSLRIADDGCGFDVAGAFAAGKGLGLVSMSERAEMLGGTLNILSRSSGGTVVEVVLP